MAAFWTLLGVVVGFGGKYVLDLQLAKKNRLREEKLKWSVEFLAAAGRLAQAVATWCNWQQELRHRIAVDPDERTVDERARLGKRSAEKRARVQCARPDAYQARTAVRPLTPDVTDDVFDYLELRAGDLDEGTDEGANPREKLEDALRKQIGS